MRDRVGSLKKARFAGLSEVGNVTEVVDRAPACAKLTKATHPHTSAFLVGAFGEDEQASLRVVVLLVAPREEDVETPADLLRRMLDSLLAVEPLVLLHDSSEEHDPRVIRVGNGLGYVREDSLTLGLLDSTPEAFAGSELSGVEVDGLQARQVPRLHLVELAGQEVGDPFEDRSAAQNEVAVARVVGVTGLVEVQDVHVSTPVRWYSLQEA